MSRRPLDLSALTDAVIGRLDLRRAEEARDALRGALHEHLAAGAASARPASRRALARSADLMRRHALAVGRVAELARARSAAIGH